MKIRPNRKVEQESSSLSLFTEMCVYVNVNVFKVLSSLRNNSMSIVCALCLNKYDSNAKNNFDRWSNESIKRFRSAVCDVFHMLGWSVMSNFRFRYLTCLYACDTSVHRLWFIFVLHSAYCFVGCWVWCLGSRLWFSAREYILYCLVFFF